MSSVYVPAESLLQSRAFRRLFAFSLAGHLIVFAALVLRPSRRARLISPSPVMVQVVSAPKAAAAKPAPAKPAPPPKAEPKPEPAPPPKPVVKEIVIPKDVKALPEKPKPVPAPVEKKVPPPTAEELLAKITERVEAQEAANAPPAPPSEAPAPAPLEGAPGEFDPLLSPWVARVKAMVRANWSGAAMCKGAPQFDVDIDEGGQLTHIQLAQSSGDRYCDATAERALQKSNPLPPPPSALSLTLDLRPTDVQ